MASIVGGSFVLAAKGEVSSASHTYDPDDAGTGFLACLLIEDSLGGGDAVNVSGTPTWNGSSANVTQRLNISNGDDLRLVVYTVEPPDMTAQSWAVTLTGTPGSGGTLKFSFITINEVDYAGTFNTGNDFDASTTTSASAGASTAGTDDLVFGVLVCHANFGTFNWNGSITEINEDSVSRAANSHGHVGGTGSTVTMAPTWSNFRRCVLGVMAIPNQASGPTQPTIDSAADGADDNRFVANVTTFGDATNHDLLASSDDISFSIVGTALGAGAGLSEVSEVGIAPDTTRYYRLRATDGTATTDSASFTYLSPPAQPSNLVLTQNVSGGIDINFIDNTFGGFPHALYRKLTSGGIDDWELIYTFAGSVTSWEDDTVSQGEAYDYKLYAFNPNATVVFSRPLTASIASAQPEAASDTVVIIDSATTQIVAVESVADETEAVDSAVGTDQSSEVIADIIVMVDSATSSVDGPGRESVADIVEIVESASSNITAQESVADVIVISETIQIAVGEDGGGGIPGGSLVGSFPSDISTTIGATRTYLFELDYSGGTLYLAGASQDILWNGQIWTSVGGRIIFDSIPSSTDRLGQSVDLELFGVDQTIIAAILSNSFIGRIARIYLAELDETLGTIGNVIEIWRGHQLSSYNVEESPPTDDSPGFASVSTRITSRLERLSEVRSVRNNVPSHEEALNRRDSSFGGNFRDKFFAFVPALAGRQLIWGGENVSESTSGGPGDPSTGGGGEPGLD